MSGQGTVSPEVATREKWGGKFEFLLSAVGYCVGLGNVWRFPYLAYRNGGGVFFIPYFLMLFFCGIPIFATEMAMGQYCGGGVLKVWTCIPAFKGIGYGMMVVSFLVMIYYNIVIAYSLYYLFAGMAKVLPWSTCNNVWNTMNTKATCIITENLNDDQLNCKNESNWRNDTSIFNEWNAKFKTAEYSDFSTINLTSVFSAPRITTAEEYWRRRVLKIENEQTDIGEEKYTMENLGPVQWELFGCNICAWLLVFGCIFKGVKSSGKVVYFTATFPYLVLIILVIFGATLDGAKEGIEFYLKPDVTKLKEGKVWADAATQIFYSLGVAFGGLMTMSSYNEFNNNIMRDTFIVCLGNCFSSVFAGFAVFSFLGHIAYTQCVDISHVVKSGPGLAFIAYPDALSLLPAAPFFSFLFFVMLILLGLDSQFAMVDVVIAGVMDEFPAFGRKGNNRLYIVISTCIVGFLLGWPILTHGGIHLFNLINDLSAYYGLLLLSLLFSCAVHYGYNFGPGPKFRFVNDLEEMNGPLNIVLKIYFYSMWYAGTPVMIIFIIIYAFIGYETMAGWYGDDEIYPLWSSVLGMIMCFSCVVPVFIYFPYSIFKLGADAFKPTWEWQPCKDK